MRQGVGPVSLPDNLLRKEGDGRGGRLKPAVPVHGGIKGSSFRAVSIRRLQCHNCQSYGVSTSPLIPMSFLNGAIAHRRIRQYSSSHRWFYQMGFFPEFGCCEGKTLRNETEDRPTPPEAISALQPQSPVLTPANYSRSITDKVAGGSNVELIQPASGQSMLETISSLPLTKTSTGISKLPSIPSVSPF